MKARFLLLLTAAGGLAIFLAMRTTEPANGNLTVLARTDGTDDIDKIRIEQTVLWRFDLPGEEPDEPAELSAQVTVDPTDGKNRLYFSITEANGYYVEYLTVDFFHKETRQSTIEDSGLIITERINDFIPANQTLTGCREIVPAELYDIGGQMGTTQNWGAEVVSYYRARLEDPEVIHHILKVTSCD